jgi:hypothetical protein
LMWPLTSQRERRASGPENFQSQAKKDFFNTIPPRTDIISMAAEVRKGANTGLGLERQLVLKPGFAC